MSDYPEISAEEALHNAYHVLLFMLEVLASPADAQCEQMGDFNTAWELRDDALAAHDLMDTGFLTEQQEAAVLEFLASVDPIPVASMPSGAGRAVNLAAMQHPAWGPIRALASQLIDALGPVSQANRAYLARAEHAT